MAISARSLKAAPVYLLGACVILMVYGFLFPVLNWPDEYRNVRLLQEGRESGYAFIYGHFARLVVSAGAHTLFGLNELTDVLGSVRQKQRLPDDQWRPPLQDHRRGVHLFITSRNSPI